MDNELKKFNYEKDTIFHYTNLYALKNIIKTRELWFTRIDSLNDFSEFKYFNSIYKEMKEQFISEKNDETSKALIDWIDKCLVEDRNHYYEKTFTLSLACNDDSIPMWNYYSDKSGVAIGFNKNLLDSQLLLREQEQETLRESLTISYGDVLYKKTLQLVLLKSVLDAAYKELKITNNIKSKSVQDHFYKLIYAFDSYKDSSFEYECEYRYTIVDVDDKLKEHSEKLDFIITDNNIKPILKMKVTDDWNTLITNIIISPYNMNENLPNNIKSLLEHYGIHGVNVSKSKCPIRGL